MKLPEIVKRIGETTGEISVETISETTVETTGGTTGGTIGKNEEESRIYIEDYVYSYLRELKHRKEILPLRAVLFGHTCSKEQKSFYFVYGAACIADELEKGRDEEQIRKLFFPECERIGYVNVYGECLHLPEKKSSCLIFYDSNEPMQNYLLSCYNRELSEDVSLQEKEELKSVWETPAKKPVFSGGAFWKKVFGMLMILLLATAVTTIDEYGKMYGFVEAVKRAVIISQIQD